ncbi:Ran-specific GTPase-activating protein 30 [Knufia fluminis]|uniref:Ran-specific GTPase-activating protein 30 n=1 Tax=Knufia fluminis TaxID=191047 RepID=A0AAN8EIU5_9EURO|nr:Ran-specific GTPase-activating protein 30 [Knufia fluminis]
MDFLLGKVTQQAMNYAIKSGVTLTASYAIKQSTKLLASAPKSDVRDQLYEWQQRLQHKIRIVSPAIDMIELIAARGNTSLESAVSLTKELRLDIQRLGQRLAKAAASSQATSANASSRTKAIQEAENENEMQLITHDIKKLLARIDDAVPLINLALTTSGAKLSTQLPSTVSPSRLLQASTLLTAGDSQYAYSPQHAAQIGPTFTLTVYMLFAGHDRPETEEEMRNTTWKEVIHKARVKLRRVPLDVVLSTGSGSEALQSQEISSTKKAPALADSPSHVRAEARSEEFAYQMMIVEDFDDDRHHDYEDEDAKPGPFDDVKLAGIREMIPVHEISKIFYADTSKVLNIGSDAESNHPVLLLRRDVHAVAPRRMIEQETLESDYQVGDDDDGDDVDDGTPKTEEDKQHVEEDHANRKNDPWRLPASLDPEWIAFEVYTEAEAADDASEDDEDLKDQEFATPGEEPESSELSVELSALHINSPLNTTSQATPTKAQPQQPWVPQIKTSLSMLELLLRLTSLQQFQQQSHLSIPDELLNFFLEESASTGAGGDEHHRQAVRADARRKVGWDPYNESPVKHRGEDYQYNQQQYYDSPRTSQHYQYSYNGSVASPDHRGSPAPPSPVTRTPQSQAYTAEGFMKSPADSLQPQTRSITGTPDSRANGRTPPPGTSVHNSITISNRPGWLKQPGGTPRGGSPLRPITAHSDEGIGTSPGSVPDDEQKQRIRQSGAIDSASDFVPKPII